MRRLGRILLRIFAALVLLSLICAITSVLIFRSGWFHELVHRRMIAEIEKATGARVEIGNFSFDSKRLEITVGPIVVHGKEPTNEPPFLRVESVVAALHIISMMERKVDLASLRVIEPHVRIVFYPDGSTNVPGPVRQEHSFWTDDLIDLAVGSYNIENGLLEYDSRRIPLNLRGEGLTAHIRYRIPGSYEGDLKSDRVRLVADGVGPVEVSASAAFTLGRNKVDISRLSVATKESRVDGTGTLTNLRMPQGAFTVKVTASVREATRLFAIPIEPAGVASFDGKFNIDFERPQDFSAIGRVTARGLGYRHDRLKIENAEVRGDLTAGLDKLILQNATATALGATVRGQAMLNSRRDFHAEGNLQGLTISTVARIETDRTIPWDGTLAGGFSLDAIIGRQTAKFQGNIGIYPAASGPVIEGHLDVAYDQAAGTVALGQSYLATPASRVDFNGTLGHTMDARAQSTNLDDLYPVISMIGPDAPKELPLKLNGGRAAAAGVVSGPLDNLHFAGQVNITNAIFEGRPFDSFTGSVDAERDKIVLHTFTLARGTTMLDGQETIAASNRSFDDASIDANLNVHNVQLTEALKEIGSKLDVTGVAAASGHVFGTIQKPQADLTVQIEKLAGFNEQADRVSAKVHYAGDAIAVSAGEAVIGTGRVHFDGSYAPSGVVAFHVAADNVQGSRIRLLSKLPMRADGIITANLSGTGRIVKDEFELDSIGGTASTKNITLDGDSVGDVSLTAETKNKDLNLNATAVVRGIKIDATGSWKLEGDEPGTVFVHIPRVDIATAHRIYRIGGTDEQKNEVMPFEGFIESHATAEIALKKPQDFRAQLTIDQVQVNAKQPQALRLGVQAEDIVLKNTKPIPVLINAKEARIQSAQFAARDTTIEASGGIPFDPLAPADLSVRGSVNLAILQLYNAGLLARGNATLQGTVHGTIRDPQWNGRLQLNNASLYLADLPNGIDNANGSIIFDRNRATIEKLTAETGGGKIFFAGFIELSDVLTYRLQAEAEKVRVRYPEDVSTTFNAELALNGTSDSSTLSGSMTLVRATFNPRSDLGGLMALAAKPIASPASPNEYLRGMQFDVRIENSPNFELQTTLTRDVEAEVDLRLRGTPVRPALLGSISVNSGEIQIFGNRYTVDRGDIRFLNPFRIEPTFDMDLETRARGITVNISFSGTMQKLNVNYSSDPPLQSSEIIALLAVGRQPTSLGSTAAGQTQTSSSSGLEAGGGLLGEALSAQLSSSVQRFFGASRVKIDPTVTGVDNLPQARLTIEQQVTKEITFTYITNLNRTQEQVVQVEYDFGAHWSAIAVRQDNGLFGIDFQYRKRLK